jgi:hypothetical protein
MSVWLIPTVGWAAVMAISSAEGMNRGWGEKDSRITCLWQEEAAGIEVRAPDIDPERAARFISTHL